jgi:general secretion pathway protein J
MIADPAPDTAGPDDGGFSLIEVIVSIGLLALILAAMPSALRLGFRALNSVQSVDRNFANQAGLDFVEQRAGEATPIYDRGADGRLQVVFRGETDVLAFVAPAAIGPEGGLYWFELAAVQGPADAGRESGISLNLSWSAFRPTARDRASADRREKQIATGISAFSLRYYGSPGPRSSPEWMDVWTSKERLPDLIELRATSASGGRNMTRVMRVPLRLKPAR